MIRTRDFLLFAVAFVFLLSGISGTYVWQKGSQTAATVLFNKAITPEGVESVISKTAYSANADRLKAQVIAGAGDISEGKPVFTSVDQVATATLSDQTNTNRAVQYCNTRHNDSVLLLTWPKQVTINEVEGARLFIADGTTKLQLSTHPLQANSPNCVAGTVVGVTTDGQLIRNDEAWRFVAIREGQLVGWALDGFPIYGTRSDTDNLDACGGSADSGTYRYYLRASEDFVLGCFAGAPNTL